MDKAQKKEANWSEESIRLQEAENNNQPIVECKKCKAFTFIVEGEGIHDTYPPFHYVLGECIRCGSTEG